MIPLEIPRISRTSFGIVTCPFECIINKMLDNHNKTSLKIGKVGNISTFIIRSSYKNINHIKIFATQEMLYGNHHIYMQKEASTSWKTDHVFSKVWIRLRQKHRKDGKKGDFIIEWGNASHDIIRRRYMDKGR